MTAFVLFINFSEKIFYLMKKYLTYCFIYILFFPFTFYHF